MPLLIFPFRLIAQMVSNCCLNEPQILSLYQPQMSLQGGSAKWPQHGTLQYIPRQCPQQLHLSYQGDTGSGHPRPLQACTNFSSSCPAGVLMHGVPPCLPAYTHLSSSHPARLPLCLCLSWLQPSWPASPCIEHPGTLWLAPVLTPAILPGHPPTGNAPRLPSPCPLLL